MRNDTLKKFARLRANLEQERGNLLTRLAALDAALGLEGPVPSVAPGPPVAPQGGGKGAPKRKGKGKGKISAAGRAAISVAAKARWAKFRAAKATTAVKAATPVAPAPKPAGHAGLKPKAPANLDSAGRHVWTPAEDALLGKLSDKEVAQRLDCTVKAVSRRRERLGVRRSR